MKLLRASLACVLASQVFLLGISGNGDPPYVVDEFEATSNPMKSKHSHYQAAAPNSKPSYRFGYVSDPQPSFPPSLVARNILEGYAIITVSVSHDGVLEDWLPLEASDKAFIKEIDRVIWDWWFDFPQVEGEQKSVAKKMHLKFKAHWSEESQSYRGSSFVDFLNDPRRNPLSPPAASRAINPYRIASHRELDRIPRAIRQAPISVHPSLLKSDKVEVYFRCYIDENGRVRMPTIRKVIGEAAPDALLLAQQALEQWLFEPPTVKGKPVTFEIVQPVRLRKP